MKQFDRKFALFLILLAFQIVSGQTQDVKNSNQIITTDTRVENAKKQAEEMLEAILKRADYDKIADFAHPKAIEIGGGREKYVETMTQSYKSVAENFESLSWKIDEPQSLIEINKDLYIVIPRTLEAISLKKTKVVQTGYLIGISTDNGGNWKFVYGKYFNEIFPTLAGRIQIPKDKTFINGIEQ